MAVQAGLGKNRIPISKLTTAKRTGGTAEAID
jgi:hypothetical protein